MLSMFKKQQEDQCGEDRLIRLMVEEEIIKVAGGPGCYSEQGGKLF